MKRAVMAGLWLLCASHFTASADPECVFRRETVPAISIRVCGAEATARNVVADFAVAFLRHVDAAFVPLGSSYREPVTVHLHPDERTFRKHVGALRNGAPPPQYAWYDIPRRRIHAWAGVNPGYLAHELMHPVVEHQLPARARWAAEGIPLFFEQFTAERDGNHWIWRDLGTHNPDRIRALGDSIPDINLHFTLQQRQMRYHNAQSEIRMLVIYLWEQGRFEVFLRRVATDDRGEFDTHFEAALERPLADIEPDWRNWLQQIHAQRENLAAGKPARVLEN